MIETIISPILYIHEQFGPLLWLGIVPGMLAVYRWIAWVFFTDKPMNANLITGIHMIIFLSIGLPLFLMIVTKIYCTDNPYTGFNSWLSWHIYTAYNYIESHSVDANNFVAYLIMIFPIYQFVFEVTLLMRGLYALDRNTADPSSSTSINGNEDSLSVDTARALGYKIKTYYHFGHKCIKYRDACGLE